MVTTQSLLAAQPPAKARDGQTIWGALDAGALPLAIAAAANRHAGLTLVLTKDAGSANRLKQALSFYQGDKLPLLCFSDWETLAYERLAAHPDIVSERLHILHSLPRLSSGILIAPITTLMHRLAPHEWILGQSLHLRTGDVFDLETERGHLEAAGYVRVETVYKHGEYAQRGSLVDIFPMGTAAAIRIDLLGNQIESLRTFDTDSQRTIDIVQSVQCLPALEVPLTAAGIECFQNQWRQRFGENTGKCPIYRDVGLGFAPAGIEYYLPLFFQKTGLLFDYMPKNTWVIRVEPMAEQADRFQQDVRERYENLRHDPTHPILPPQAICLPADELFARLKQLAGTKAYSEPQKPGPTTVNFATGSLPDISFDAHAKQPAARLQTFCSNYGGRILFCADSAGRREVLLDLLQEQGIAPQTFDCFADFLRSDAALGMALGYFDHGALLTAPEIAIVTEHQLFGAQMTQHRRRRVSQPDSANQIIQSLLELKPNDAVVHIEHGVGRYQGLKNMDIDGRQSEFLVLSYANAATLYVPVASLQLISRYTGADPELAPWHRLGSSQWKKAQRKAAAKARDMAAQLLDIHARRAAQNGFAHTLAKTNYRQFAEQFPFEETPDQAAAILAVQQDMCAPRPMDRLICGDVGFGKTEVAMRAAFIAVSNGKQVAFIAPTTLLVRQHTDTLQDRFAHWPINVEMLSRFRSGSELRATQDRMLAGQADIVVGTHKLLQPNIRFKDLGLLIIDEEHRFGVRHKERLKALRSQMDILTLTATPIPRTLHMAMSGLRDLSIIATPPARRLAIKTLVQEYQGHVVKEAIQRELLRGGQVYYVHNKIQSIHRVALELAELVPEAQIAVAYGQMHASELERVMSGFYHQRTHILLCTTIIENGIDIPNANTIIIDRADRFGLAQLHQLRGRVGRSHHQAYAYLLTPPPEILTKDAGKRLAAVQAAGELGVGFSLATHDLEIRGAGELLGEEQSGEIQTVGFARYTSMLESAIKSIKANNKVDLDGILDMDIDTEIDMQLPALIPETYIFDVHTRLVLYKRIAAANPTELTELRAEIIDRFGAMPVPVDTLLRITAVKIKARPLGIHRIVAGEAGGRLEFTKTTKVSPDTLVQMIQANPEEYRLGRNSQLHFQSELADTNERFSYLQGLLKQIAPRQSERSALVV